MNITPSAEYGFDIEEMVGDTFDDGHIATDTLSNSVSVSYNISQNRTTFKCGIQLTGSVSIEYGDVMNDGDNDDDGANKKEINEFDSVLLCKPHNDEDDDTKNKSGCNDKLSRKDADPDQSELCEADNDNEGRHAVDKDRP